MENRGRVLSVDFSDAFGRTVKASPLTAIDYGQILEIHGLPLPPSFECHFSKNGATAYKSIGTTTDGVGTVPFIDQQTQSGGIITAYIYLHETADDGETEYRIIIPVESRPGVTPAEPTPVEQDVIAQAISALNTAVTTTTENVAITEANKQASAQSAEDAEADANRADTAWNGAVIAQNSAQASADVASTKATEASQSASTAHSEAQYAKSYSESAHTDAQSAEQSATSAQASATSASNSATLAQQYASTATAKASEAMQSAQSASTSAQTATQKAQDAQQSATQANTSATNAQASAQSATASEASASASAESAQESAESAQASADRAEQEADRWYEILPVDTATGSIAHFTDGAKDVPVKALSVDLEPIQDLHGQDSPYPAGGGKNLLNPTIYSGGSYNASVGTVFNLTVSDVQFATSDNKTFTINTTASWQAFTLYFPVIQQKYRTSGTISAPTTLRVSKYYLDENFAVLYVSNKSDISQSLEGTWNADTAVDGNARYVAYVFTNASTASETITVTEPMAEVGTTTTTYAPYSNICPITGHTQVVVNRTGINVWDEEWELGMWNPTGQKAPSDRIIRCKNYISVLPSTQYYVYFPLSVYATGLILRELAEDYSFIRTVTKYTPATFTTGANTRYVVWCTYASDAITTYNNDISINYPSTDTEYHVSAGGQTVTVPLGDTVYGGTLDVVNGVLTVDRAMVERTSANQWKASQTAGVYYINNGATCRIEQTVVCDKFKGCPNKNARNLELFEIAITTDLTSIVLRTNDADVDAFKARLDEMGGFNIVRKLATPITINLTAQQMTTLLGINNIWSDSGDVSVEYRTDIQLYIQKMIANALNA